MQVARGIEMDETRIQERFVAASGPGGQHVNKNATAVQLQLDIHEALTIEPESLHRLRKLAGRRLSDAGILTIEAQVHRSQHRNRAEAWQRLLELLRKAAERPKRRRPTKPTRASKRRRLDDKRHRGAIKNRRGKVDHDD